MQPVQSFGENFPPKSIAIVGVSQKTATNAPGYNGLKLLRILRDAGFEGRLYPVNPKVDEIEGFKAYANLTELPETPDLVIVAVQAAAVPGVLRDCVTVEAANAHICTSGFSETGEPEGRRLEEEIREIALRGGLRVIGPNCMGFYVPSARMQMFEIVELVEGPVAFLSQSGGHAMTFLKHGPDFDFGFSKVISYGNALTLDGPDFLEYLATDCETGIICMYIEGVRDGRRLLKLARQTSRVKPIIIWKSGLTDSGARAAASHTGSLAGDRQVWDAFFHQTGAIRVDSTEEMAEAAMTLLKLEGLRGGRAVVLSGGGGNSVATGDICAQEGLELAPFSAGTRAALEEFISSVNQGLTNPMDVAGVLTNLPLLRRTLDVLVVDPLIDVVVLHMSAGFFNGPFEGAMNEFQQLIADMSQRGRGGKPVVIAMDTSYRFEGTEGCAREFRQAGLVVYGSLRRACRALRRVAAYKAFLAEAAEDSGSHRAA
jgi:acyl-CoA synthetase (NDP forming)